MENNTKAHFIIVSDEYITIKLVGICDATNFKNFEAEIIPLLSGCTTPHLIINCEHLTVISRDWIRSLLKLQTTVKSFNKSMRLILINPPLEQFMKKEGIDTAFKASRTLRDALIDLGILTKKALDTEFINPFLSATLHVLNVQANVKAEPQKIYAKKPEDKFYGDISGIIGIVSEAFNGSVVISFPSLTFLKVMSSMLGEEYNEVNKDILDGAGEITNMIFGQAKVVLNEKGYGIKSAIPSVVAGKEHTFYAKTKGPIVVVPFKSSVGDFYVEICLSA